MAPKPKASSRAASTGTGAPVDKSLAEVQRILAAQTFFDVLNFTAEELADLAPEARELAVKRRYREISTLVHPDKCAAAEAQDAFIRLGAAHKTFSDSSKYRAYALEVDSGGGNLQNGDFVFHRDEEEMSMEVLLRAANSLKQPWKGLFIGVLYLISGFSRSLSGPLIFSVFVWGTSRVAGGAGFWRNWLIDVPIVNCIGALGVHALEHFSSSRVRSVIDLISGLMTPTVAIVWAVIMAQAGYSMLVCTVPATLMMYFFVLLQLVLQYLRNGASS